MSESFMVCYKNAHSELQLKPNHVNNTSPECAMCTWVFAFSPKEKE